MNEATAPEEVTEFPHHAVFAVKFGVSALTQEAVEYYSQLVIASLEMVPSEICDFIRDPNQPEPAPILEFGDCEVELIEVIQ